MTLSRLILTATLLTGLAGAVRAQEPLPAQATQPAVPAAPGVTITQAPPQPTNVRLGCCQLPTGLEPLYIINGQLATREQLTALNPSDIQKVNILKKAETTGTFCNQPSRDVIILTLQPKAQPAPHKRLPQKAVFVQP
jgi:hypothetical protein